MVYALFASIVNLLLDASGVEAELLQFWRRHTLPMLAQIMPGMG
jgi:hypothetical protein